MKNKEKIKILEERVAKLESLILKEDKDIKFSIFTQDESILKQPKIYNKLIGWYVVSSNGRRYLLKDLTMGNRVKYLTLNSGYRDTELQAWEDREKYIQMQNK